MSDCCAPFTEILVYQFPMAAQDTMQSTSPALTGWPSLTWSRSTVPPLGGTDFVLHFHGFDDKQALARFDLVSFLNEDADYFAGHGSEDLLAAFGFERAVLAAAPGAGIDNFG